MEPLPNWLEAAVAAAGMTTVYNADDWQGAEKRAPGSEPHAEVPPSFI